ncbi:hypothetical protein ACE6H2_000619 [Prunus campanulata]
MFSRCGLVVGDGFRVFDEMPDRNLVTWTLMISAAVQDGQFEWGLEIYLGLIRSGLRPNEFTIVSVLKGSLLSGCRIHGNIEFGEWTAKKLVPENDVPYVLLSKFLARSDEAELDGPHPTSGASTKRAVAKGND